MNTATLPKCPQCNGETEMDGSGGFNCHFCGHSFTPPTYTQQCAATCEEFALLGFVEPDPIGVILGTGYMRFQSPNGLGGLAKWTDDRLDLLAVHAFTQGQGQFRSFIAAAKLQWKTICVWQISNPFLGSALERYGFTPETEIQSDGEIVEGFRWDRAL